MSPNPDTIARLVSAYTDAIGGVVSNTVGYMAAADSEERGRIQRDLRAALEKSRQHLWLLVCELAGGAAMARPEVAEGPPEPAPRFVPVEGWREQSGVHSLHRGGVVVATAEWGRHGNWAHWHNRDGRQMAVTTTLDDAKRAAETATQPAAPVADDVEHTDDCEAGAFVELGDGPPPRCTRHVSAAAPKADPAAPTAVAGWVVRATYVCVDGKDGVTVYASNANTGHTSSLHLAHRFPSRDGLLEHERSKWGSVWRIEVLPVDAAGNVLEERAAPGPDVVAQCRAALESSLWEDSEAALRAVVAAAEQPAPAQREPDGWIVVDDRGRCTGAWTRGEFTDPEKRAKSVADKWGHEYTARPFYLDTPPVHPSSLTDVVTTLEEERNMLRANIAALREASDVAVTVRDAEAATLRAEVKRLTRERDEARAEIAAAHRRIDLCAAEPIPPGALSQRIDSLDDATDAIARKGERDAAQALYSELRAERDAALALARQCREVALGERERIVARLRDVPAPALPEVP